MEMDQSALWERFHNHMLNEGATQNRIAKLKQMFKTCQRGLPKGYEASKREDIETFMNKLNRNEFKTTKNNNYSGSSKADIKKFLRQFYKWLKGNNEVYPKEVSWLKARISKDEMPEEKPVISPNEALKLANSFSDIRYKILVLLLFDSGFRIQEMLSVKKKDLT